MLNSKESMISINKIGMKPLQLCLSKFRKTHGPCYKNNMALKSDITGYRLNKEKIHDFSGKTHAMKVSIKLRLQVP